MQQDVSLGSRAGAGAAARLDDAISEFSRSSGARLNDAISEASSSSSAHSDPVDAGKPEDAVRPEHASYPPSDWRALAEIAARTGRDTHLTADDVFGAPGLSHELWSNQADAFVLFSSLAHRSFAGAQIDSREVVDLSCEQEAMDMSSRFEEPLATSARSTQQRAAGVVELERMDDPSPIETRESRFTDILCLRMMRIVRSLGGADNDASRTTSRLQIRAFIAAAGEYRDSAGIIVKMMGFFDNLESICGDLCRTARCPSLGAMPLPTDVFEHPAASGEYFTSLATDYIVARTNHTSFAFSSSAHLVDLNMTRSALTLSILRDFLGAITQKRNHSSLVHFHSDHDAVGWHSESRLMMALNLAKNAGCKHNRTFFTEIGDLHSNAMHRAAASRKVCIVQSDTLPGVVPDGRACEYRFFVGVNPMTSSVSSWCAIESIS
mmetsp:Transcript_17674/g.53827  ORF Transcript_17674/g.53827 Transcript_17674/m.53827 type:complete len:437 (+) Transcript_17674:169-1479(+)